MKLFESSLTEGFAVLFFKKKIGNGEVLYRSQTCAFSFASVLRRFYRILTLDFHDVSRCS